MDDYWEQYDSVPGSAIGKVSDFVTERTPTTQSLSPNIVSKVHLQSLQVSLK